MPKYVIQYDLSYADGQDYTVLIEKLEQSKAVRVTESCWYMSTSLDAAKLAKFFRQFMHKNDVLVVDEMAVCKNHSSYSLPSAALAWRNAHLIPKTSVK